MASPARLPAPTLRILGRVETAPTPARGSSARVHVLVAVPHAAAREGIGRFLSEALDLETTSVCSGAEAMYAARTGRYGVLLLDAAVSGPDAFEVMSRLRVERPGLRVLFLAAAESAALPLRALEFGAAGHLDSRAPSAEFVAAVRAVARGERYLSPLLRETLVARLRGAEEGVPQLTAREFQVLRLLAQGNSTEGIGGALSIAPSTVRSFKARLREKLGLDSDVALARYALERGIG